MSLPLEIPDCHLLFLYHTDNEATRVNLNVLKAHNPDRPIVGIAYEGAPDLKTIPCWFTPRPKEGVREFENNDDRVYHWFLNAGSKLPFPAERYLWVEWDTLVTQDVREWFGDLWDVGASAAGSVMVFLRDPWVWFDQGNDRLDPFLRSKMMGVTPLSGILLSHAALKALVEVWRSHPVPNAFCELRVGTLLNAAGYPPAPRPGGNLTCVHDARLVRSDWRVVPGFYHPVKVDPAARNGPPDNWREELHLDDSDFEGSDPILTVLRRLVGAMTEEDSVPTSVKSQAAYALALECVRLNDDPKAEPAHHTLAMLRRITQT